MRLYDFFWSNAPSRVRIALALKRVPVETFTVDVAAGSQHSERFQKLNPLSYVPVLEVDGIPITQSMAILEYLESRYPSPALLPADIAGQARVRSLAFILACDSQPLVNLRIRRFLQDDLGLERRQMEHWVRHWIAAGLEAYEKTVAGHPDTGEFSHGDSPSFADVCLAPHVVMAKRFGLDTEAFPWIRRIYANSLKLEAFSRALLPAGEKPPLEWMTFGEPR